MTDTELIDHTGRTVFRGTQKPPGGGSQPTQGFYDCGSKSVALDGTPSVYTLDTLVSGAPVIDPATSYPAADGTYVATVQATSAAVPADGSIRATLFAGFTSVVVEGSFGASVAGLGSPQIAIPLASLLTTADQVFVEVAAKGTGASITVAVSVVVVKLA